MHEKEGGVFFFAIMGSIESILRCLDVIEILPTLKLHICRFDGRTRYAVVVDTVQ